VPTCDEPVLDELAGEVGQPFDALGGNDDLDAFKVASSGQVRHRVLSFS
jgi:hypothetical protein